MEWIHLIIFILFRQQVDRPLKKPKKFAPQRIVFVFGAIGPVSGNVIYYMGRNSFNAQNMEEILREIR